MKFGKRTDSPTVIDTPTASSDAVVADGADVKKKGTYKSKRGRRVMALIIALLVLLLLVATVFLLNLIRPKGNIAEADKAGGVSWVRSIYGYGPGADEQLVMPATVAFDRNGDVIIPNVGSAAVRGLRFDNAGGFKRMFAGSKEGWLAFPSAVDVAPDGRIYFAEAPNNQILVMNSAGTKTERVIGVEAPSAIDVTDDTIAVGAKAGWVLMDLEGKVILGPIGTNGQGDDQYDVVSGITIDADDNIYVVDTYNNRISKFDREGKKIWAVRTGSPANQRQNKGGDHIVESGIKGEANLQTPSSAALDSAGRLLVIDPMDFTIAAFNTDTGKFIGKWGAFGKDDGQFMYPTGMAYDPVRDWVAVADTMNNRVQIVRVPGTGGGTTEALARSLTGPIRACLLPLAVLLLLIIAAVVYRTARRRKERAAAEKAAAAGIAEPVVTQEP